MPLDRGMIFIIFRSRLLSTAGAKLSFDGDMPNGVCQQKDLCATPAVSKEAQSLESNRHGD